MIKSRTVHFLKMIRLGDKIEYIAKPIAMASDNVFRTNLKNCKACGRRKRALNGGDLI